MTSPLDVETDRKHLLHSVQFRSPLSFWTDAHQSCSVALHFGTKIAREVKMTPGRKLLAAMFMFCFASFYTTSAFAFCGTIRASASGLSDEDALKQANALGLVKVRQLNQKYGSRVVYQPAKSNCKGTNRSTCVITQSYCVAGSSGTAVPKTGWPKCGPNSEPAPNDAGCRCKAGFEWFMGACEPKSIAQPWTTQACKSTKLACSQGSQSACRNVESRCNPN